MDKPQRKGSILAAVGLFFLSPLIAEFLLGDFPITWLGILIVLAPMYGGGALLIREVVRRSGRGWPSIILLALAYGVLEEAFTTQSLFNTNYLRLNLHLLDPGFIPALGIGAWWTVFVLALHTVWSISVSIALVEACVPSKATTPWLGNIGLAVTAILFVAGVVVSTTNGYRMDHFLASHAQFASSALVIIVLIVAAFLLRNPSPAASDGFVPNPWLAGTLALAAGSAILLVPKDWGWWGAAAIVATELGMAATVLVWSKPRGWGAAHKLALAAGAALAYGWHAFLQNPVVPGSIALARISNAIFFAGAVGLITFAGGRVRAAAIETPATTV